MTGKKKLPVDTPKYEQHDITCLDAMKELFQQHNFDAVMNLAALSQNETKVS